MLLDQRGHRLGALSRENPAHHVPLLPGDRTVSDDRAVFRTEVVAQLFPLAGLRHTKEPSFLPLRRLMGITRGDELTEKHLRRRGRA